MARKDFEELLDSQRKLQSMVAREQEMTETIDILSIINEMSPYPDQRLQKEALFVEAESRGFSQALTEQVMQKLVKDRVLFEPMPGYIQRR